MSGKVYLVGAGPGDPELLTLKAARLLAAANVVLHDALVSEGVLALISRAAEVINVGKRAGQKLLTQDEINSLLVSCAQRRQIVVRLKGGDPTIFGRAGEEIEALRKAGIACVANPPYYVFAGKRWQRGGLGMRYLHDHACSVHAGGRLRGSFGTIARRRAAGGSSVRDRLARQWFRAASALVERRESRERRETPRAGVIDRRARSVTGRCRNSRIVLGQESKGSGW